jgi:hypothetical protein
MKRNQRNAFKTLKGLGVPVYEGGWDGDEDTFRISAEENYDTIWADYYMMTDGGGYEFGVHPVITKTLTKYGLHCEWCNPGVLDVYEN